MEIIYKPIGFFESPYTKETGAPRQGILVPETDGRIIIETEFSAGLKDFSQFEYIWVIYHLNNVSGWENTVNPPKAKNNHDFGVFATRSPRRPNPIGIAAVKLVSIVDNILYIKGFDAFDGTPVLDLKPYLPSIDNVKSIHNEFVEKDLGHHDENFISDKSFYS